MYMIAFKCEKVLVLGPFSLLFTVGRLVRLCKNSLFIIPSTTFWKILTVYVGVKGLWDVFLIPFLANNRLVGLWAAVGCIQYVDFHVCVANPCKTHILNVLHTCSQNFISVRIFYVLDLWQNITVVFTWLWPGSGIFLQHSSRLVVQHSVLLKPFRIFYITCPSFPEQVQGGYEEKPLSKFLLTAPRNHWDSVCKNSFWAAERGKCLYKRYLHYLPRGPCKLCPNV